MESLFWGLRRFISAPDFLDGSTRLKAALCGQIMENAVWQRRGGDMNPYRLYCQAEVGSNGQKQPAEAELLIDFIGGHSGCHAYLYAFGQLVLESSSRTDAIAVNENHALEQARRDFHKKAEQQFGVDMKKLYADLFPVNIAKKQSRKALWIVMGMLMIFFLLLIIKFSSYEVIR